MATYTQDRVTQEQKRRENIDILYKNANTRDSSARKEEPSPYVQDEAYTKRGADDYKNNRGYFSYSPYGSHTVEQKESKPAPAATATATQTPVYRERVQEPVREPEYAAPVMQRTQERTSYAPAGSRITRIEENEKDSFEPAYDIAPAKAITKKKLVKKNTYDYEEETSVSLSTNMKVVLALIASIIIIAFTVIFVNSALLNSLEAETMNAYTAFTQIAEQSSDLVAAIEQATSAQAAADYAVSVGMILG